MGWLIHELEEQVQFYTFFSTFFKEKPSNNCFALAIGFVTSWYQVSSPRRSDENKKNFTMIQKQVLELTKNDDLNDYIDALSQEYERLFFAPGRVLVSLYESTYFGNCLLMQEKTINVRQHYLEARLLAKSLYTIPEDHLAIELEFMQYLSQKILGLIYQDGNLDDIYNAVVSLRNFINEHLMQWIPKLVEVIKSNSRDPFYQVIIIGLQLLIENSLETLNWLIYNPRSYIYDLGKIV